MTIKSKAPPAFGLGMCYISKFEGERREELSELTFH